MTNRSIPRDQDGRPAPFGIAAPVLAQEPAVAPPAPEAGEEAPGFRWGRALRGALMASAAGVALLVVAAPGRDATAFVCANCTQEIGEIIREVKRLAEYGKMIQNGIQQVQIARATVDAFTNIRDLGSAVSAFGMVGVQNPVPELNVYALQNLLSGTGGAQGMVGSIGGLYAGTSSTNTQFNVPVTHYAGRWINQQIQAASGSQAVSLALNQSAEERARHIASLQRQIAQHAGNPAAQAQLANQLAAYQAQIGNQQIQAAALANYSAQQQHVAGLAQHARFQQSAEEILQQARARGWF
jgi:hypothetical protein